MKARNTKPTAAFADFAWHVCGPPRLGSELCWCSSGRRSLGSPTVCSAQVCLVLGSVGFRVSVWPELGSRASSLLIFSSSSLSAVTNKHHFADGALLYQFRMNFRRRRRLMELLYERGRGIPESHDSPFCLRKQSSDGGNTSFLSGRRIPGVQPSGRTSSVTY